MNILPADLGMHSVIAALSLLLAVPGASAAQATDELLPGLPELDLARDCSFAQKDASVTARVWQRDDTRSISHRVVELREAYHNIGALLDAIDANCSDDGQGTPVSRQQFLSRFQTFRFLAKVLESCRSAHENIADVSRTRYRAKNVDKKS